MNNRIRKFSLVTYAPSDIVNNILQSHIDDIQCYAYILHNLDTNADGELKTVHTHILLYTFNAHTPRAVCKWFTCVDDSGKPINTLFEPIHNNIAAYDYLTHKNNPDKYQYKETDIIAYNPDYFTDNETTEDNGYNALNDLLQGVPLRQIARTYGRDFIRYYSAYKNLANDIVGEELRNRFTVDEQCELATNKALSEFDKKRDPLLTQAAFLNK